MKDYAQIVVFYHVERVYNEKENFNYCKYANKK